MTRKLKLKNIDHNHGPLQSGAHVATLPCIPSYMPEIIVGGKLAEQLVNEQLFTKAVEYGHMKLHPKLKKWPRLLKFLRLSVVQQSNQMINRVRCSTIEWAATKVLPVKSGKPYSIWCLCFSQDWAKIFHKIRLSIFNGGLAIHPFPYYQFDSSNRLLTR